MKPGKYKIKAILESRKDESGSLITENVPINMDITFNGQRLRYYTNYRIDLKKWDTVKEQVKINNFNKAGESAQEINRRITDLRGVVSEIFRHYENLKAFPTKEQLKTEIRTRLNEQINHTIKKEYTLFEKFDQFIKEVNVSPLRRKQLDSCKNHLERFDPKVTFESLDIDKFKTYLMNDTGKDGKKNKSLNTIAGILKRLRAFLSYARKHKEKWTKVNPFENYSIDKEEYGKPIYLTREERDILINADIPIDILAQVRDMFILQCFIGARIADFVKLKKDNIVNGAIEYTPAKTAKDSPRTVRIPLSDHAKRIISKYNTPDGSLMPFIPDQRYNVYLKDLFQFCKLNRPVVRLNPLTRKDEVLPLFKLASSHMARRTFVGLLHKTTKNEVIASMSGHVNDSRAFSRYYKIDEETQDKAIKTIE